MPVRLVDLHEDFSALSHQTRMLPIKPNFAHRHPRLSLGDALPISDYVNKNPNFKDKVLASDVPALKNADVALVVASSYCNSDGSFHELYPWHKNFYTNLFKERSDILVPAITSAEFTKSLKNPHKTAVVRSIEGIYQWNERLDLIDKLWADGIRSIIPVHNADSNIGTGCFTKETHGLTELGKKFMTKVIEQGFIVDLSHLSDKTAIDVLLLLEKTERPPIISHTGSRSIVPNQQRSTRDDIAIEVARRGGLVGIMPTSWLVEKDPATASVDSVVRTIDHYLNLFWRNNIIKPEEKIAIGTDFCGMGTESIIKGIETIEKLGPALQKAMKKHKYPKSIIKKVFSENAINYFLKWLPNN
jgi:microsomal dipeptidase-like Zn-dependent dipeptidase